MPDGFLGRWSRRKIDAKEGRPPEPEPVSAVAPPPAPAPVVAAPAPVQPPPTLDDAQALTPESDFTRFTQPDVAPEVKNAAFKKLFADPHFNVMDRMDVYIDDYSQPDPIPPAMLRNLASARFLKLFGDDEDDAAPGAVAQSGDADPDLRLQQDDAPPGEEPGHGTG